MDNIKDMTIYDNDIELYLHEFMQKYNIDDLCEISQNQWNAALIYINKHVFNDRSILYIPGRLNNEYDFNTLDYLCNIYINMCLVYDKECSLLGYCRLININDDTLQDWKQKNTKGSAIYKKIMQAREDSLSNMLTSRGGKRNPVGVLGVLNHNFDWANSNTIEIRPAIAAADPALIAKQYTDNNIQIAQKPDAVELPNVD